MNVEDSFKLALDAHVLLHQFFYELRLFFDLLAEIDHLFLCVLIIAGFFAILLSLCDRQYLLYTSLQSTPVFFGKVPHVL